MGRMSRVLTAAINAGLTWSAGANDFDKNDAWRFQAGSDPTNRAFVEDFRIKQSSGFYSAPVYNMKHR